MSVTKIKKDGSVPSDLHVDQFLTNLAVGYAQDPRKFIAPQVFPIVPVQKQSDKYPIWDRGYFWRDEVGPRPLGGRPRKAGAKVTSESYYCEEEGLEYSVDDRVRANADQPFDPDKTAMRLLTTQVMIHNDRLWTDAYFKAGVWGTDLKGAAATPDVGEFLQLDQAGSEPVEFVDEMRDTAAGGTGYDLGTLVVGRDVYRKLKNHPEISEKIKYSQKGVVTQELLAELLGVDKVLVPGAVMNRAKEGQPDDIDYIVGRKDMLLVHTTDAPSIDTPSGGYTFAWTGLIPGLTNAFGGVIERAREELAHSDVFQIREASDQKVVAPDLGVFFEDVVA